MKPHNNTDIRCCTGQLLQGSTPVQESHSSMIHHKTAIDEAKEPSKGGGTTHVHGFLEVGLNITVAVFAKVLMLRMGFTLPILNM